MKTAMQQATIEIQPSLRECTDADAAFREAIEPVIKLKTDIYAVSIPKITMIDGVIKTEYQFSESLQQGLDHADRLIAEIGQQFKKYLADGYFR
jgi:hypothetical protein